MLKQRTLFTSIIMAALTLGAVGCGSKVGGTYTFNQTGNSVNSACSSITLNLTSSSNQVNANGGNGQCTETLTGYDNGNGTITVQSLTMTLMNNSNSNGYSNQSCIYTGMLNVSGNSVSGSLNSQSNQNQNNGSYTYNNYSNTSSYCGTLSITGTKN